MRLETHDRLTAQLIVDEGMVLHAYQDPLGFWTVGVGRLIDRRRGGGITAVEAMYLLQNDVARLEGDLLERVPIYASLDDVRQATLLNMAFTLGASGVAGFKRMIAALHRKNYGEAAGEMLQSSWANQVGLRALRLARQMRTGEWG